MNRERLFQRLARGALQNVSFRDMVQLAEGLGLRLLRRYPRPRLLFGLRGDSRGSVAGSRARQSRLDRGGERGGQAYPPTPLSARHLPSRAVERCRGADVSAIEKLSA